MNLHQFRFVQEAVRRDLNLTETAKALFTSQPGVSKAILELEGELGVDIFARHGKRLRRVTEPGREVLKAIEVIMREVGNLKRIGDEFSKQDAGTLSIATTHSQARYFLPGPIAQMRKRFPKVNISLHQGTPEQVAKMVYEEVADFGLATESLDDFADLGTLPCYASQHVLVLPGVHSLAPHTQELQSRSPDVGTTILTVMSALAQERGAVNLGQGFPDFDCDPKLVDAVDAAMRAGLNQYPPMTGIPVLRERIAAKMEALY